MTDQKSDNQWVRTRAYVGEHMLEGHEDRFNAGCMICVAFKWGQELGQMSNAESRRAWKLAVNVVQVPDGETHADR